VLWAPTAVHYHPPGKLFSAVVRRGVWGFPDARPLRYAGWNSWSPHSHRSDQTTAIPGVACHHYEGFLYEPKSVARHQPPAVQQYLIAEVYLY
jgi:hypothetical protein